MENRKSKRSGNGKFSLQLKLQQLEQKRFSLVEELKLAALNGDLLENFDWVATRQELARIRDLEKEVLLLKQKTAFATNQTSSLSKVVTYQLLSNKQIKVVQLTNFFEGSEVDSSTPQKISFTSPLGLALVNKRVGEVSEVRTKKGNYGVKILSVEEK